MSAMGAPSPYAEPAAPEDPAATPVPAAEARPLRGGRGASAKPTAAPARGGAALAPTEPEPPAPEPVSLETLLRVPVTTSGREPERPSVLEAVEPPSVAPAAPSEGPRWRDRIQLERRSEPIGPAGPRQGTWSETDAGLRVPVDERISLEGGVRVDQREDPGQETPERKSSPRVGVEVRF